MKCYRIEEITDSQGEQVFRISPFKKAVAMICLFSAAICLLAIAITGRKPLPISTIGYYYFSALTGVIGLIPLRMFRASLKPSSWFLRFSSESLLIKYSSYLNWKRKEPSFEVIGINYSEIAWAKIVREVRRSPSVDQRGGTVTSYLSYIELGLQNPDTAELERVLAAERTSRKGIIRVSRDCPVRVLDDGIVQIRWTDGIRPSAVKAIECLESYNVTAHDIEQRSTDLTHHSDADPNEERGKIVELIRSGDIMGAEKFVQLAYGYNLSKASEFVSKLRKGISGFSMD